MSGPKHTPWKVHWPPMADEIYVKDAEGHTIATVYVHGPDAKSNADFIAAAPRLAEALKGFLAGVLYDNTEDGRRCKACYALQVDDEVHAFGCPVFDSRAALREAGIE